MSVAAHPANSLEKPPPRPKRCKMRAPRPCCLRRLYHTPNHTFAPESSLAPHCAPRPSTALISAAGQRTVRFALRNAKSRRNGHSGHSAEHEHCARQPLLQQKSWKATARIPATALTPPDFESWSYLKHQRSAVWYCWALTTVMASTGSNNTSAWTSLSPFTIRGVNNPSYHHLNSNSFVLFSCQFLQVLPEPVSRV